MALSLEERKQELETFPPFRLYQIITDLYKSHPELGPLDPVSLAKTPTELISFILSIEYGQAATATPPKTKRSRGKKSSPKPPVAVLQESVPPPAADDLTCPVCGKTFKSKVWLDRHIKEYHAGVVADTIEDQQNFPTSPTQPNNSAQQNQLQPQIDFTKMEAMLNSVMGELGNLSASVEKIQSSILASEEALGGNSVLLRKYIGVLTKVMIMGLHTLNEEEQSLYKDLLGG